MDNDKAARLLVLPWSPDLPGGVSVVVRNLTKVWDAAQVPNTILVSSWSSRQAGREKSGALSLKLAMFGKLSAAGLARSAIFAPVTLWRTLSLLKQRRIGTVYFHYANLDAFGIALLKRLKLFDGRLVLCFHGTDVRKPEGRIAAMLWNTVFGAADAITACSNALALSVEETFGLPSGRVDTVYNGVDTAVFAPASAGRDAVQELFGPSIRRYVVSVGSFIPRKGHVFLLEAFARAASAFPDAGLVVVGMDGRERAALESRVAELGLQHAVRFLVDLRPEQVAQVVAGAALCVQPSIAEPFGMAVIEAGACGVCVAASAVGGHTELIADGLTGRLFEPGSAHAIEAVLLDLLGDEALRTRLAEAFHARVVSTFTWKACADLYGNAGRFGFDGNRDTIRQH